MENRFSFEELLDAVEAPDKDKVPVDVAAEALRQLHQAFQDLLTETTTGLSAIEYKVLSKMKAFQQDKVSLDKAREVVENKKNQ